VKIIALIKATQFFAADFFGDAQYFEKLHHKKTRCSTSCFRSQLNSLPVLPDIAFRMCHNPFNISPDILLPRPESWKVLATANHPSCFSFSFDSVKSRKRERGEVSHSCCTRSRVLWLEFAKTSAYKNRKNFLSTSVIKRQSL
jgi:hypothetical protein